MQNALNEIASYLLGQSWQIAVVFVVVAGACWALRKSNAHWRYLLWLVVLAKCLVPPLLSVPVAVLPGSPTAAQKSLSAQAPAAAVVLPEASAVPLPVAPTEVPVAEPVEIAPQPTFEPAIQPSLTFVQWLAVAWMAGAAAFLLCCLFKAWRTQGRLRRTRQAANADLQAEVAQLAARLGVGTVPKIWLVDGISQPFVWGLLRGGIYLPGNFGGVCKAEDRRGILMHELAHVSRWDAAVNGLQVLVQAAFFFHPLVWWANRKIRQEREKCCDEVAIASLSAKPKQYGRAIVDILVNEYESSKPVPSLAVAGPVKNIEERIKTMMRPNRKFYKRPTWLAVISVLVVAALAIPTTLTLTARAEAEPEPTPSSGVEPTRQRHFVMLVVRWWDKLTFQGQETTWEELPSLLAKVPNRKHTVLEVAMSSEPEAVRLRTTASGKIITIEQKEDAMGRAGVLQRQYGFESVRHGGVRQLGSRAGPPEAIYQGKFEFDKEIPVSLQAGTADKPSLVKCKWIKFTKDQADFKATLHLSLLSWPKAKWRVNVILYDTKNKHLSHATAILENSGWIRGYPIWSEEDLQFSLGQWPDLSTAVKFEVNVCQVPESTEPATQTAALPGGLVLYYSFDRLTDESGVIDLSGNSHRGQVHGAKQTIDSQRGGALSFDGQDDYISIPELELKEYSFAAWVKTSKTGGSLNNRRIFMLDGGEHYYAIQGNVRGGFGTYVTEQMEFNEYDWQFVSNVWTHIAVTFDGSTIKIYINGELTESGGTGIFGINRALRGEARIGGNASFNGGFWHGMIDEVLLFNRALSESEIKQLYEKIATIPQASIEIEIQPAGPPTNRTGEF